METREENEEVLFALDRLRTFSPADIEELAGRALRSRTGKIRICLHHAPGDLFHEMLVALRREVKYLAQFHPRKEESYCILKGSLVFSLYGPDGEKTILPLGDASTGRNCFVRIPAGMSHRFDIDSEVVVFLEAKLGPFSPNDTVIIPDGGEDDKP
ncbi:MAG: WbuC family cupin fold metalloprotein [Planctomycetota bacterium]|jgi:cupin fold WbuC family metalloprotein|nr:WbuC family cupin fold metalloprotein [Planctomycetota bacterium]